MKQIIKRFRQDILSISLLGLSIFISIALLSYNPKDPSFNTWGGSLRASNYCGLLGGFVADTLYHLFGLTVWLLVFSLIKSTYSSFRGIYLSIKDLRLIWVSFLTLNMAGFLSLNFPELKIFDGQIFLGGILGLSIAKLLLYMVNFIGAEIFLISTSALLILFYFDKTLTELFRQEQFFTGFFKKILNTMSFLKKPLPQASSTEQEAPKQGLELQRNLFSLTRNQATKEMSSNLDPLCLSGSDISIDEPVFHLQENENKEAVSKTKPPKRVENWDMPKLYLLDDPPAVRIKIDKEELRKKADLLLDKLAQFSIQGQIVGIKPGPAVTLFEFKPNANVKVSRITELAEDLTLALSSESLRIIAPLPGRDVVGIESSNAQRDTVYFKDLVGENTFWNEDFKLPIGLGRQANGEPKIVDLRKMPHLLIAGTTGSGKSVFTVSLITGLLLRHSPSTLRLILIDPKQVDLAAFSEVPHLIMPPIREPKKAVSALKWAIREMEKRYRSMAKFGARGLESFNEIATKLNSEQAEEHERMNLEMESNPALKVEQYYFTPQPYLVIVVEEFGDLMSVDKQNVEQSVVRLAQMARACGIHLILAMQSPRKEVVTGLIKANIPGRISFKVASKMDSRIILDESGAERLLAQGDMLFLSPGVGKPQRHHGPFLKETEIMEVAKFWSKQAKPVFSPSAMSALEGSGGGFDISGSDEGASSDMNSDEFDEKYDEILAWTSTLKEVSASLIQRRFRLGYPRAARMVEIFEKEGVIGPANGSKPRQVLVNNLRA